MLCAGITVELYVCAFGTVEEDHPVAGRDHVQSKIYILFSILFFFNVRYELDATAIPANWCGFVFLFGGVCSSHFFNTI